MSGILVIAEHLNGQVTRITKEIIGAAVAIKENVGGNLSIAVLTDSASDMAEQVNLAGVDEIVLIDVGTSHFDASRYEHAIISLGDQLQPSLILIGHTANGIAYAASLAAQLGAGFASDVIGLRYEDGGALATRSAYAGKVNLDLAFPGKAVVIMTCRGATFAPPAEGKGRAQITQHEVGDLGELTLGEHVAYIDPPVADVDIGKSEIILSVGRGIQNPDNIPRFAAIAENLGITLGCSRPFADSGHLAKAHQVGQSGTVAANCKLYIAVGISGAVQHLYGMKHVDTIIAVNNDPTAPIFGFSTYGSTNDAVELAGALESKLGIS